ncbi:MAG: glycosyltransferase family 39 protein [Ginsengibacter sp.]
MASGNSGIKTNPFIFFLPALLFYTIFIIIISNDVLWGDEALYINYAQNLLHGFYSDPPPKITLSDGPGYSLFILPFIALHLPFIVIRLMNAVLIYLSVILLYKVLVKFVPVKRALFFSIFWAAYYNYLDFISLMCSETLGIFLIAVLIFLLVKAFDPATDSKMNKYLYLAGFALGYLVLTKVIFGYVLLCMFIGVVIIWITKRRVINYRKTIIILLVAFVTITPYLIYTYNLTGKIYYLGTSGGNNLYWMSSPAEGEYGSWFLSPSIKSDTIAFEKRVKTTEKGGALNLKNRSSYITGYEDSLKLHHQKNFEEILSFNGAEKDDAYKRIALDNIHKHPGKFIKNCVSNVGRILFNYPYSYTIQKSGTLIRFPLNGIILVLMLFCAIPTIVNWKKIAFAIRFMLLFAFIYLGGSVLGSAEFRMFTVVVPIILLWIATVTQKSLKIKITGW